MTVRVGLRSLVVMSALAGAMLAAMLGTAGCATPTAQETPADSTAEKTSTPATAPAQWTPAANLEASAKVLAVVPSPDASLVAYTVTRFLATGGRNEMTSELYLGSADGGDAQRLAEDLGSVQGPVWSPDGKSLAVLATPAGDEEGAVPQVYFVDVASGEASVITSAPAGVMAFDLSPKGDQVAFATPDAPAETPGPGGPEDDATVVGADPTQIHIWRMEAKTGAKPTPVTKGDLAVAEWDWSPDGARMVFSFKQASDDAAWASDISVVEVATGKVTGLIATPASEMSPSFSPDGETIAFIQSDLPAADFSAWRVQLLPTPGGTGGITRTLAATANDFPELVGWSSDGEQIYFHETSGTAGAIGALPVSGKPPVILTSGGAVVENVALNDDGTLLGFSMEAPDKPSEGYVGEPTLKAAEFEPVQATGVNEAIIAAPTARTEVVSWPSSADGLKIEGILTYPMDYEKGTRYPLVLYIHGGPAEKHSNHYFGQPDVYPVAVLSQRGYAVLRVNPRGSSGYGASFRKEVIQDWREDPYEDLMSGVDHVIDMGVADEDRLAVVGWSYGGFMTATITSLTDRFSSACVGAGPTNLVSAAGTMDLPDFLPNYMEGHPWEVPDVYRRESPLTYVEDVKTPTMILHGTEDSRVPFSQGEEWHSALKARGVETTMVAFPRSGHVVHEPQLALGLYERSLAWIEGHMPK